MPESAKDPLQLVKKRPFNREWEPCVHIEGVFSPEECDRIVDLRTAMKQGKAAPFKDQGLYRDSQICWIRPNPESAWLFDKLRRIVVHLNGKFYRAELDGFTEPIQLSEYGVGHFYDWHLDTGKEEASVRKLSFTVQLSDPSDYEGGDMEVFASVRPDALPRTRGTIGVFPSYLLHRVNKVTKGTRISIVGWIGGPPYR